jgi:hypothetical protein
MSSDIVHSTSSCPNQPRSPMPTLGQLMATAPPIRALLRVKKSPKRCCLMLPFNAEKDEKPKDFISPSVFPTVKLLRTKHTLQNTKITYRDVPNCQSHSKREALLCDSDLLQQSSCQLWWMCTENYSRNRSPAVAVYDKVTSCAASRKRTKKIDNSLPQPRQQTTHPSG